MILSADTNRFLYTANSHSPHRAAARRVFGEETRNMKNVPGANRALPATISL